MKSTYQVRSYDGHVTKDYRYYSQACKFSRKLINDGIMCGIWELVVDKNEDGTDNLDTLRWVQVIGC